jgi:hypothetical protein
MAIQGILAFLGQVEALLAGSLRVIDLSLTETVAVGTATAWGTMVCLDLALMEKKEF